MLACGFASHQAQPHRNGALGKGRVAARLQRPRRVAVPRDEARVRRATEIARRRPVCVKRDKNDLVYIQGNTCMCSCLHSIYLFFPIWFGLIFFFSLHATLSF